MDLDPTSQADIERLVLDLIQKCSHATIEVGKRSDLAARAETAYRVKFAKEFLKAEGSMDLRKQTAEVACADELLQRKLTDGLLTSAIEAGRNARARLDAARSLLANIRAAVANATGYGA